MLQKLKDRKSFSFLYFIDLQSVINSKNPILKDRKQPFLIAFSYRVDTFALNFKTTCYEKTFDFIDGLAAAIIRT